MKISYKHIIKHFSSNPSIKEISEKLFQLGHENEIEENEVLDIEFTPNRGDCLSLQGIIRDLSIFYEIEETKEIYEKIIDPFNFKFNNDAKFDCPRISFLKIEIEDKIDEYKDCLEFYFKDLGIKKNNFFTDVSNYIAYETGQPTHCYDAKKINSDIYLKKIKDNKNFKTLIGKDIDLKQENLVFSMNDKVINLAGVMGGESTSCSENTKEVIIECAYFRPESIIGKALTYDLQSDAAYKFERGVDPLCHERVLRRFIQIVQEHVKLKDVKIYSDSNETIQKRIIDFDVAKINKIIGINIGENEYKAMLHKLGFQIEKNHIIVPSFRSDIYGQNDLAEEVARIIGYDSIPRRNLTIQDNNNSPSFNNEQTIKNLLIDNGFYEVINNPFVSTKQSESIKVDNPLDSNKKYLRSSLKSSLIECLLYNERRQKDSIKFFEISDVYTNSLEIEKRRVLGIIASGRVGKNHEEFSKKIDENYFSFLDLLKPMKNNGIELISRNSIDSKSKNKIIYCEINIDNERDDQINYIPLSKPPSDFRIYDPISEYPSTNRDLSFSINDPNMLNELKNTIENYRHNHLKELFIFDFYVNSMKNEIKIGFRFIFQSNTKTLVENEVNLIMKEIIDQSLAIESVTIPGLQQ